MSWLSWRSTEQITKQIVLLDIAVAAAATPGAPPQLAGWAVGGGGTGGGVLTGRLARLRAQFQARRRPAPEPAAAPPAAALPAPSRLLLTAPPPATALPAPAFPSPPSLPPPALPGWSHGAELERRVQRKQDEQRAAAEVLQATRSPLNEVLAEVTSTRARPAARLETLLAALEGARQAQEQNASSLAKALSPAA